MLNSAAPRRGQKGLSLVELMVGIAVGLFVVAAASTLVATQLTDNRRLLLEVQVQQDLRAAADIIARDLRRAGSWGSVTAAGNGVATGGAGGAPNTTPIGLTLGGSAGAASISYYSSRTVGTVGPYGFRRNGSVIQSQLAAAGWQPLTDENTMEVTAFDITPVDEPPVRAACNKRCSDGTQDCWPTLVVRSLRVNITGQSTTDSAVRRSVSALVRLRNDRVNFNDAANPTLICPV